MRIELVTPAAPGSHHGNRVTAERWEALLVDLGHDVGVTTAWSGEPVDVLVALHARRSAAAVRAFRAAHRDRPVVVALTGTDLYADLPGSREAQETVEAASALVVLQERAYAALPPRLHPRVHVVHQSVEHRADTASGRSADSDRRGRLEVVVLAHLRPVKDPLLAAEAARLLPSGSRVRISHLGAPLEEDLAARARAETSSNPHYRWLGDVPRAAALARLAASDLLVLTSRLEGGANAVSEAIATGTPVLSTQIDGSVGLLGADYPGFFPVGDAAGLARLLHRAESEPAYLSALADAVAARRPLVEPGRERQAWADLLATLPPGPGPTVPV